MNCTSVSIKCTLQSDKRLITFVWCLVSAIVCIRIAKLGFIIFNFSFTEFGSVQNDNYSVDLFRRSLIRSIDRLIVCLNAEHGTLCILYINICINICTWVHFRNEQYKKKPDILGTLCGIGHRNGSVVVPCYYF